MPITLDEVKKAFEGRYTKAMTAKDIAEWISVSQYNGANPESFLPEIRKHLRNEEMFSHKKNSIKYKMRRPRKFGIVPRQCAAPNKETLFIGAAGELAVMSELAWRSYNVCRPAVDKGVDIIATKDNIVYHIQVKTSSLGENLSTTFQIDQASYNNSMKDYVRYILALRCGENEWRFFTFSQEIIDSFIKEALISKTEKKYTITIRYDEETGRPRLTYKDNQKDVSSYQKICI